MNIGIIKFYSAAKGFGFVTPEAGGAEIFLPSAAVSGAKLESVTAGQRIFYEQGPSPKGPKIVSLKLIPSAPKVVAARPLEQATIYYVGNSTAFSHIIESVREAEFFPATHDFGAVPPSLEVLRMLAQMLSEVGQTLVCRTDPLFFGLQLDDRFISDQEFWTAIAEHPSLLNGPIVVARGKARICKTASETKFFLGGKDAVAVKPKSLSPRMLAMLKGNDPVPKPTAAKAPVAPAEPQPLPKKSKKIAAKTSKNSSSKTAPEPKRKAPRISNAVKAAKKPTKLAKPRAAKKIAKSVKRKVRKN